MKNLANVMSNIEQKFTLFKKNLEDGWSTSFASKKAGISAESFAYLIKHSEEFRKLHIQYKKKVTYNDFRYRPRGAK